MRSRFRPLWLLLLTLVPLWAALGVAMWACDRRVVTPERTRAWLAGHPLGADLAPAERRRRCAEATRQVCLLTLPQRLEPELAVPLQAWTAGMSADELTEFQAACFARTMGQLARAMAAMTAAQRTALMEQVMKQRPELAAGANGGPALDPDDRAYIMESGLDAFMKEADPATRQQLMPLLMAMQMRLQHGGAW